MSYVDHCFLNRSIAINTASFGKVTIIVIVIYLKIVILKIIFHLHSSYSIYNIKINLI